VGKGTVVDRLVERDPDLWLSRSWTTRVPRPGEGPDSYNFVDRSTFEAHRRAGGFLESATVLGELYGTPVPHPPPGRDIVLEIDVQGAAQVLEQFPDAVCVLLMPPTAEEAEKRLRDRGDSDEHIRRRLDLATEEEPAARKLSRYVVVNDDLDRAVDEVAGIIEEERKREESRKAEGRG
jgi:guanylate kinase